MAEEKEEKKSKMEESTLCKLMKKEVLEKEKKRLKYFELILNPRYVCEKCGRAAHSKKNLCKPIKIDNSAKDPE